MPAASSAPLDAQQVLGYLNFASGAPDIQFLAALNRLAERLCGEVTEAAPPLWQRLLNQLDAELTALHQTSPAFANVDQARAVLALVREHVLPGYRKFHADLLFHQSDDDLFNGFFIGRVCEVVLAVGGPWTDTERITSAAIVRLNDYVGHRPVPTLEAHKVEPYAHEKVRPVPLFIRGAGVSHGRYQRVILRALELLESTDADILQSACCDPRLIDELAFDPRAYDFDHPANKRPNYHFGQWDPHHIDNKGEYRRFVVQQVSLEALLGRFQEPDDLLPEEFEFEAAAVLAGIVLMATGVSGRGPDTYDSTTSLSSLLPRIAQYRDQFYERLLAKVKGAHGKRLRHEAEQKRQPFGGARQELNAQLARRRAAQLEHVHLARLFARMGYPEAAARQANVVPAASARMLCRIDCLLTAAQGELAQGERQAAAAKLPEIMDLLNRAIACGAAMDPWNILGFDAQYSLFPSLENSVRDHRADDMTLLMERIFALYSSVWSEAAGCDDMPLAQQVAADFRALAERWHKYAWHEVSSVNAAPPLDVFHAAEHVAESLRLWHQGGAAAGDVKFWAEHAGRFDSPKAYALVIEALLERDDYKSSLALLVAWLSQGDRLKLEQGESSFFRLAESWLRLWKAASAPATVTTKRTRAKPAAKVEVAASAAAVGDPWILVRRFFDFLEANAEHYWEPPRFDLLDRYRGSANTQVQQAGDDEEDEEEENDDTFDSAYENMVYRDSTNDGVESNLADSGGGSASDDELDLESRRLAERLDFLACLARLWKLAAVWPPPVRGGESTATGSSARADALHGWLQRALHNQQGLLRLLGEVESLKISLSSADQDGLMEYDRRRLTKESLLEKVIATCTATADAARLLAAAVAATGELPVAAMGSLAEDEVEAVAALEALLRRDFARARRVWPRLLESLGSRPLLYVPVARGGDGRKIVDAHVRQQMLAELLRWLPRCGMLLETCQLLETAREMERNQPVGAGAVTEFDDLFEIGYQALVSSLVDSAERWQRRRKRGSPSDQAEVDLVGSLESLTEALLASWLAHSRTLRLSVLERVREEKPWRELVQFIETHGARLFTQKFFNISNVRAILHQGVEAWLEQLSEADDDEDAQPLLEAIAAGMPRERAIELLTLVLEAILENYGEYRDYNSTTTQSDRGELLYMLLDFLRLRVAYDRVAWNLKPVVLAHEILVRRGQHEAAALWRRALAERIREEADRHMAKLAKLQKQYAMRMPTVADRLQERFVRPMLIDRVRALIEPAIREATETSFTAFELLEQETASLTEEPSGVGLDVPAWLMSLEDEVELASRPAHARDDHDLDLVLPPHPLSHQEIQRQLDAWSRKEADE